MHAYVCWHWTHRTDLSRRDASLASLKKAQHARTRATALLRFLLHAGHSFLWLANTKARCSRGKQAAGENASLGRIASAGCECLYRLCHKVSLDTSLNDATSRRPKKHGADHKRLATAEAQIAKEISSDHSNGARGQLSPQIAVPPCRAGKFPLYTAIRSNGPLESVQEFQPDLCVSVDFHARNVGQADMLRGGDGDLARLCRSWGSGGSCQPRPCLRRWSPGDSLGSLRLCFDDLRTSGEEARIASVRTRSSSSRPSTRRAATLPLVDSTRPTHVPAAPRVLRLALVEPVVVQPAFGIDDAAGGHGPAAFHPGLCLGPGLVLGLGRFGRATDGGWLAGLWTTIRKRKQGQGVHH